MNLPPYGSAGRVAGRFRRTVPRYGSGPGGALARRPDRTAPPAGGGDSAGWRGGRPGAVPVVVPGPGPVNLPGPPGVPEFDSGGAAGTLFRPIGQVPALYGRLVGLLG